jgi:hypothetical protein
MNVPTLAQHDKMTPTDRQIWDDAYAAEFQGLENLSTWKVITEEMCSQIRNVLGNTLPSMAIATIKRDENSKLVRAKYRIVNQ